jgi:hypothetical protein
MKKRAIAGVQARAKLAQQITDQVFSFAELAQEVETSRYLAPICWSRTVSTSSAERRHPDSRTAR